MIKIGDIVKLKNPKKREAKRRWRVIKFLPNYVFHLNNSLNDSLLSATTNLPLVTVEKRSTGVAPGTVKVRRLDTATHRLERNNESNLIPVSFWERITKRW